MEKLPCKTTAILTTIHGEKAFDLDVPFVPTPLEVVNTMLAMANIRRGDKLYDLGCGDGRIVILAAKKYDINCIGVDLDPRRIQECTKNALKASVSAKITFLEKNFFDIDLSDASVVSLYLLSNINLRLRSKLFNELKPGSRIISHDFNMDKWLADKSFVEENHSLFLWTIPANMSGKWRFTIPIFTENIKLCLQIKQHFQKAIATVISPENALVKAISIHGNSIEIKIHIFNNKHFIPLSLRGTISDNNITGKFKISEAQNGNWNALRDEDSMIKII